MLFFPEFLPEKNNTDKEKIDSAADRWIFFNGFPCLLHFFAPVDIIKNQHRVFVYSRQ